MAYKNKNLQYTILTNARVLSKLTDGEESFVIRRTLSSEHKATYHLCLYRNGHDIPLCHGTPKEMGIAAFMYVMGMQAMQEHTKKQAATNPL